MVFNLPSLPSGLFTSLIDTSPPVFYPASASRDTPTNNSRARSRSRSQSITGVVRTDSPHRPPHASPSRTPKGDRQLGSLIPASASVHELTGEWEPLAGGGLRERRGPVGTPPSPMNATPVRPTHRRAHSALPSAGRVSFNVIPPTLPAGRLQEFSRNPLASTSAISLPTLAEGQIDTPPRTARSGGSMPPSPLVRPLRRNSARTSPISPNLPSSSSTQEDIEEISELDIVSPLYDRTRTQSSVPPPQAQVFVPTQASGSMPPPPLKPMNITYSPSRPRPPPRPLASPRSWSSQDIHAPSTPRSGGLQDRRGSIGSVSSASLSDVEVLATWSFPNNQVTNGETVEGTSHEERGRRLGPGPSERLKERLKNIPGVETGPIPTSSRFSSPHPGPSVSGPRRANTFIRPSRPLPSHLTGRHRHTHSSPNLLQIPGATIGTHMGPPAIPSSSSNPLFPPPKPVQRRPTTSRLRQPNPLSMHQKPTSQHHSRPSISASPSGELGSSPGSIHSNFGSNSCLCPGSGSGSMSDASTSCASPTPSIKSLAGSSSASVKSVQTQPASESEGEGEERTWWAFPGLRGRGLSFARNVKSEGEKEFLVEINTKGRETFATESEDTTSTTSLRMGVGGWDTEDEEAYIDLDNM